MAISKNRARGFSFMVILGIAFFGLKNQILGFSDLFTQCILVGYFLSFIISYYRNFYSRGRKFFSLKNINQFLDGTFIKFSIALLAIYNVYIIAIFAFSFSQPVEISTIEIENVVHLRKRREILSFMLEGERLSIRMASSNEPEPKEIEVSFRRSIFDKKVVLEITTY